MAEKLSAKTKIPAVYLAGDSTVTDRLETKAIYALADATVHGDSALHILSEAQPLIIRRTADLPQKPVPGTITIS